MKGIGQLLKLGASLPGTSAVQRKGCAAAHFHRVVRQDNV